MLVESDDKTDLTRLETTQEIAIKHYLDCAMPLKFTKLPSPLLDIGSGAGFPRNTLKNSDDAGSITMTSLFLPRLDL